MTAVASAAIASMTSTWIMICSVLPSIRLREAAVVNLGSNAVANTLPAGGALAMGVSWAMLSSWGVSTAEYVLYTLVSGIWNVFARLGLPVLALLVLVTAARPGAGLVAAAAVGLALLAAMAYLPPIPLGAIACLTWRHAPALIHAKPILPQPAHQAEPRATVAAWSSDAGIGLARQVSPWFAAGRRRR